MVCKLCGQPYHNQRTCGRRRRVLEEITKLEAKIAAAKKVMAEADDRLGTLLVEKAAMDDKITASQVARSKRKAENSDKNEETNAYQRKMRQKKDKERKETDERDKGANDNKNNKKKTENGESEKVPFGTCG